MNRFPSPPVAPAANIRAVISPETTSGLQTATGKPLPDKVRNKAYKKLSDFNAALHSTDAVPIDEIAGLEVSSRQELVLETSKIFQDNVKNPPELITVEYAALAGSGVTVALLEVITTLVAQSQEKEYDDLEPIIGRSAKTLMELASHGSETDKQITMALGSYAGREIRKRDPEYLFSNLCFVPELFVLKNDTVSIDYTNKKKLKANGESIDYMPRNNEVLLGCPYYSRIGQFYSAMTRAAINAGLLRTVYEDATK